MTHDPDHDLRALRPEPVPWELQNAHRHRPQAAGRTTRGSGNLTRVVLALILVVALVAALVLRW